MSEEAIQQLQSEALEIRARIAAEKERLNDASMQTLGAALPALPRRDIRVRRVLKGHLGKIYALHWATQAGSLISASQDGKLIVWDPKSTCKTAAISLRSSWVMTCALSADGTLAASGGLDNMCTVHSVDSGNIAQELVGHSGFLSDCRFIDSDLGKIVTCSGDASAMLWDIERNVHTVDFNGHSGDVMSCRVHSNTLLTVSLDLTARLWDIRTGECTRVFVGHEADVNACEWFPDGNAFATGADDQVARLFDVRADRLMCQHSHPDVVAGITSLSFSKSGRVLYVGHDDNNCGVWDVLRGERVTVLAAHNDRLSTLAVSPDGDALATGSWDSLLKIWA
jgi:guanine nucleotide-binding protein G(I)/G(S)/G(T) subunit beta-1